MINEKMFALGDEPSAIRVLFAYGLKRKAEIGADRVFDYSIGNPSVPAPPQVAEVAKRLLDSDPVALHGYTPSAGAPDVREAVASHISRRYDVSASASNVYLTHGAAAALAISIAAITVPDDEVIVISPYFPEYKTWIDQFQCTIVEVPAAQPSFQPDIEALAQAIGPKTSAVIINSPNNPVGAVYTKKSLDDLAALLTKKEEELGRQIYLISDEPYRLISYGAEIPWVPCIYPRTIVCNSFSKSLSLPGERIGYIYVADQMDNDAETSLAIAGAGRALGYICASVLFQRILKECIDLPSDVESYRENRKLLTEGLGALGYEYVEPDGAFYLWVKALEPDAKAFSERAKQFELLLVPSDSFGVTGWVRLSYCIAKDTIVNSMPAFKALMESYK
ncbi:MAG: pyridoxal phosphate-dependent aminotransferase [Coriobacteriales bacterium]|nr:pyridoxal phosphate-dependent aminotransferase [Coriobacteriales bacterium]